MVALVLKKKGELAIPNSYLPSNVGSEDAKIAVDTVNVRGSSANPYTHGRIGDLIVREPMVFGHEGSKTVIIVSANVTHLAIGDRACMELDVPCEGDTKHLSLEKADLHIFGKVSEKTLRTSHQRIAVV